MQVVTQPQGHCSYQREVIQPSDMLYTGQPYAEPVWDNFSVNEHVNNQQTLANEQGYTDSCQES